MDIMNPEIGTKSMCLQCNKECYFNGEHWTHVGPWKPRHTAKPRAMLLPQKDRSPLFKAKINGYLFPDKSRISCGTAGLWGCFDTFGRPMPSAAGLRDIAVFNSPEEAAKFLEKAGMGPAGKEDGV